MNLLVSKEERQAHKLLGDEGKWKHPPTGCVTFQNGLAKERAHGGGSGRSWGRETAFGRMGVVESVPGSALGSQGDGEGVGELELAREVVCRVYWTVELCWELRSQRQGSSRSAARCAQKDEVKKPRASTSRVDTDSKQLRGGRARTRLGTAPAAARQRRP